MITIYWHNKSQRWLSAKTNAIVEPVKAGMLVDPDLCDEGWQLRLRKYALKNVGQPFTEIRKLVK